MQHLLAAATAATTLLLVPATDDPVRLVHGPVPGLRIERTLELETVIEGGDLEVVMDGQRVPEQYLPAVEFEATDRTSLVIADEHRASGVVRREIADGERRRAIDVDFGDYPGMEPSSTVAEGTTPLEGVPFELRRDASGEVRARWVDEDVAADDALLDGLRLGLDPVALLPEEPVEVGAVWEADAAGLAPVLAPGGELGWEWSGEDAPSDAERTYEGALELRLVELLPDGLARIEVAGEVVERETAATTLDGIPVTDGDATEVTTTTSAVEGELLWDVENHVLRSLELELVGTGEQVVTRDPGQPGASYESTTQHDRTVAVRVACRVGS